MNPTLLLHSPRHNRIICICTPQSPSTYWQRGNTEIRIKRTFSTVKMCAGWTFLNGPCSRPRSALRFGVINTSRAAADDSEAWLGGHGQPYTSLIHGTQLHFNLNVDLVMQVLFLFSWAPYYYVLHSVMDREVTRD